MWRFLLVLSILPIVVALLIRWWFGLRVLAKQGRRLCRCDTNRWQDAFETAITPPEEELPAGRFGENLRRAALVLWIAREPKAAKSREGSRRFGLAAPPLSGLIAVFALFAAKIPVTGALAIFFCATAFACVIGLLTLAPELRAIAATARHLRESRVFHRKDDEDAVVESAIAHAWNEAIPPVLRLNQR